MYSLNCIVFICVTCDFFLMSLLAFNGNLVPEKDKGLELVSYRYTETRPYVY